MVTLVIFLTWVDIAAYGCERTAFIQSMVDQGGKVDIDPDGIWLAKEYH